MKSSLKYRSYSDVNFRYLAGYAACQSGKGPKSRREMWRDIVNLKMKNKRKVSKDGATVLNFELSPSVHEQDQNEEAKEKCENLGASFYDLLAKVEHDQDFLFELVRRQDHKALRMLLTQKPTLISSTETETTTTTTTKSRNKNKSLLHVASQLGHLSVMATLINCGLDINVHDDGGNTALHDAVAHDCRASISLLLHQGADPNILNKKMMAPLHLAVVMDRIEPLKELLCHPSVDPNVPGEFDSTPLHYAAWRERPQCAKLLLDHKAALCRQNAIGLVPAHVAAQSCSSETLEVLIQKANSMGCGSREEILKKLNQDKSTPLHTAVMGGNLKIVEMCLKAGYEVTQEQENGNNSIHLAASQGSVEMIKLLLSHKPENRDRILKSTNDLGHTVLHESASMDRFEALEFFINEGVDLHVTAKNGCSALLTAAKKQAWRSLNILLKAGSDWNARDENSRNILHLIVIGSGQPDVFNACFKTKVMTPLLNDSDKFGCTPLHYASKQGFIKTISHLLQMGAQLTLKSNKQQSALHFAASCGRINTCKELLRGVSSSQIVNETDSSGQTPLHLAAAGGHDKVVTLLLKVGAGICKDIDGNTPLHLAAISGYTRTIMAILSVHNHLMDATNKAKNTCLHLAVLESQTGTISLFLNLGAKMQTNIDGLYPMELAISKELKDSCMAFITHDRWREAMDLKSKIFGCNMVGLIENLPEVCQMVLDRCRTQSGNDQRDPQFHYTYDFSYLQVDPLLIKESKKRGVTILPLISLNLMVKHNRVDCLYHPLCLAFLHSKWLSYGVWFYLCAMLLYGIFLGCLTTFVVGFDFKSQVSRSWRQVYHSSNNGSANFSDRSAANSSGNLSSAAYALDDDIRDDNSFKFENLTMTQKICIFVVAITSVVSIIREVIKAIKQKMDYLKDANNMREVFSCVLCAALTIPLFLDVCDSIQWQLGALAVFVAWFNILVYLQGFDVIGIYVVMFLEILQTLVQVITVFSVLIVAFGLAFYISLNTGSSPSFETPQISLVTSSVMMLGAIDYFQIWVDPDSRGELPNQPLNYFLLLLFILLMPILLINLMIGLAVGDIGAVLQNARLKKIAMQIGMYTDIEMKLPTRIIKMVDQPQLKIFTNSTCSKWKAMAMLMFTVNSSEDEDNVRKDSLEHQSFLYRELHQQKMRLKQIQKDTSRNYDLLKLIVQKMEIKTEAEDVDEGTSDLSVTPRVDDSNDSIGWSSTSLKHSMLKQVFANWTGRTKAVARIDDEEA